MVKLIVRNVIAIIISTLIVLPCFIPVTANAAAAGQKSISPQNSPGISGLVKALEPEENNTPPKSSGSISTMVKSLEPVEITAAQSSYSVSKSIKSFKLNATGSGPLTYSSSDGSVASVSSAGVVSVKKNGTTYITISDGMASKKIRVRVSDYKPANGLFVEAMSNIDSKSGDSSGRELLIKKYPGYNSRNNSRSWGFIIRCNDPEIASNAALAANYIANNNHFGYGSWLPVSQRYVDNRASIYNTVVKTTGKNPSAASLKKILSIKSKADASCTPLCLSGYWLYYDMSDQLLLKWIPPYNTRAYKYYCGAVNVEYHQLEDAIKHVNSKYREKGMIEPFTIIYIPASKRSSFFAQSNIKKNLKRGDIICSCPNYQKDGHSGIMM